MSDKLKKNPPDIHSLISELANPTEKACPNLESRVMWALPEKSKKACFYLPLRLALVCSVVLLGIASLFAVLQIKPENTNYAYMPQTSGALSEGAEYNDERISNSVDITLAYIEGSFGALMMLASGLLAICFLALASVRQRKAYIVWATVFLGLAVGSFIVRSTVTTFFNTESIEE